LDGAFEIVDRLLEGLEVELRGMSMNGAKDAQGCGDVWARTNGRILEAAREGGIDVIRHAHEGWCLDVRKAGHDAGIRREWRGFAVRHALFVQYVTLVL
jgi:hypothetical protein